MRGNNTRETVTRPLSNGEREIAHSVYRGSIDLDAVRLVHRPWWPFQPRNTVMAPCGHIHFHQHGQTWSEDFSREPLGRQGLFVHEMCHVWQAQHQGKFYLPLMRHPFCHYRYEFKPGKPFARYGLEQQAEIAKHVFFLKHGVRMTNGPPLIVLESILPF